jgi:hypothetical protein
MVLIIFDIYLQYTNLPLSYFEQLEKHLLVDKANYSRHLLKC